MVFVLFFHIWVWCECHFPDKAPQQLYYNVSGMLYTLSFCPLFILLFIGLLLSLWSVVMLSCCVPLVWVPFQVFLNCSLWVYVWFIGVCFSMYFRMSSKGLWLCVCPTDPIGIAQLLSMLASYACCSWWSAILSSLYVWCMICDCGYGLPFLLLYHWSTVHHLLAELLQ